jgi:hypothetical protein
MGESMTNKLHTKWVLNAVVLAWAATIGVNISSAADWSNQAKTILVPEPQLTSSDDVRAQIIDCYEQCKSDAEDNYKANWDANCTRIHEKESDDYYTCLQEHPGTQYNNDPWHCGNVYRTDTEPQGCALPTALADSLKNDLAHAQDLCLKECQLRFR